MNNKQLEIHDNLRSYVLFDMIQDYADSVGDKIIKEFCEDTKKQLRQVIGVNDEAVRILSRNIN